MEFSDQLLSCERDVAIAGDSRVVTNSSSQDNIANEESNKQERISNLTKYIKGQLQPKVNSVAWHTL
eukprot:scaffold130757_cov38-Cyclotella_meneghiniana.AAC.1